jgi:hypothetical protein
MKLTDKFTEILGGNIYSVDALVPILIQAVKERDKEVLGKDEDVDGDESLINNPIIRFRDGFNARASEIKQRMEKTL